jgi:hypothetical protein
MVFTKRLRDGARRREITCSVRIWKHPHVKVGGRYPMEEGEIEVDTIERIALHDTSAGELRFWASSCISTFRGSTNGSALPGPTAFQ